MLHLLLLLLLLAFARRQCCIIISRSAWMRRPCGCIIAYRQIRRFIYLLAISALSRFGWRSTGHVIRPDRPRIHAHSAIESCFHQVPLGDAASAPGIHIYEASIYANAFDSCKGYWYSQQARISY
jgi:hypothetical protein